jgi:hypothetical protein
METALMEQEFDTTEYEHWESGVENDAHLVLRETQPWKVRERWAKIRLRVHEMTLERELMLAHITEHLDMSLDPVPSVKKKMSRFDVLKDKFYVHICRFMHREPNFRRGDQYSVCPTCKRKYAIPFADVSKLPADVYMPSKPFPMPTTPTRQALCRNGLRGVS